MVFLIKGESDKLFHGIGSIFNDVQVMCIVCYFNNLSISNCGFVSLDDAFKTMTQDYTFQAIQMTSDAGLMNKLSKDSQYLFIQKP